MSDATPKMPYTVQNLPWGLDRVMPHKIYPTGTGELMTADEVAVWEYVLHLEAANAVLLASLDAATTPEPESPPPPVSVKPKGKGTGGK